jgi:acetyl-CoA carboxylase biotin carboxylase subunit
VLVANRGEIAIRVIRTLRDLGIESHVIVSDVDVDSLPSQLADGVVEIGGRSAVESYLDIEKVLDAARRVDADAIHPGYGFLSERADFARAVEGAGIAFLGPTAEQIENLGDKLQARRTMSSVGIGPVPGTDAPISDLDAARKAADAIGLPLLLKAAAGGGGKGIRIVRDASELDSAFRLARSEAESSFGSPLLFAERYLEAARHVEVQVVGDGHGGVRVFRERDCSIQRRLQKLVEETPCPSLDNTTRERLLLAARDVVRATKYRGAGTLEFLHSQSGELFFLEMNTRIQVEHPISEETSGADIVAMQLAVASGERYDGVDLSDVAMPARGVAIELRLNAEDPLDDFRPSVGRIDALSWPSADGVRVDTALVVGTEITPYYDPLLAKIIVRGDDREQALARLRSALDATIISGVTTTLPVGAALLDDEDFRRGDYHCQFLEARLASGNFLRADPRGADLAAVVAALAHTENSRREKARGPLPVPAPPRSSWTRWKLRS